MDTITTFAKENFQLILLFFSMLGVLVGFISLFHEIKKRKRKNEKENNDNNSEVDHTLTNENS